MGSLESYFSIRRSFVLGLADSSQMKAETRGSSATLIRIFAVGSPASLFAFIPPFADTIPETHPRKEAGKNISRNGSEAASLTIERERPTPRGASLQEVSHSKRCLIASTMATEPGDERARGSGPQKSSNHRRTRNLESKCGNVPSQFPLRNYAKTAQTISRNLLLFPLVRDETERR